ncbi:hypothetical protein TNCV_2806021 [Trichonephila clavipes]|nr:hypothetical protein TNCV_2806021 [Trichonephila clavipes]
MKPSKLEDHLRRCHPDKRSGFISVIALTFLSAVLIPFLLIISRKYFNLSRAK